MSLAEERPAALISTRADLTEEPFDIGCFGRSSHLGRNGYLLAKRVMDVTLASVALVVLAPVFLAIALAILITDGRPVIFKHRRVGRGGRPIPVLKFRSMRKDAELILQRDPQLQALFQEKYKLDQDPRITKVGQFLRDTSLDELPQLVNVLCGHMSLVGPRPIVTPELQRYGCFQDAYLSMIPGCTGLWQCSGRSDTSYEERVELDLEYSRKASVAYDLSIMMRTFSVVLNRKGAR